MCIQCRNRIEQQDLVRLQCIDQTIVRYTGSGRSFYICHTCKGLPGTVKHLKGRCKVPKSQAEIFEQKLRETLTNG